MTLTKQQAIIKLCFLLLLGVLIGVLIFKFAFHPSQEVLSPNEFVSGDGSGDSSSDSLSSGDLAVVVPPPTTLTDTIRSLYLTGWSAGTKSKRESVIENMKEANFNAVVIDIKDEAGQLSYNSSVPTAITISASKHMIADIQAVIQEFHDANLYVIGRIVTFKDPTYAKKIPENAYHKDDGSLWSDYNGNNWPNPYNEASWEYPIALAQEAATLGFDEIQFDYVRFPSSEGKTKTIAFGFDSDTKTKSEVIQAFLTKAKQALADSSVVVSADVFGVTTKKVGDFEHIGQDFQAIAQIVDVICPMIYPSHYGFGEYGIKAPDTKPYEIVTYALEDALDQYRMYSGDRTLAKIRPYLQDFSASWLGKGNYILYETPAVTAQIQAGHDLGIDDFTLWDPNNKYAYDALEGVVDKPKPISGDASGDMASGDAQTSSPATL